MTSPALRLQVVGVNVVALADGGNDAAYILAVLDDRVADREIAQGDFVPDRHVLIGYCAQLAVVLGYDNEELRSGGEVLDDHDADVVAVVVY
jgi:hypothetical protein